LAGHETTSLALSWSLYLLAKHPEVAQTVREEARAGREGPLIPMVLQEAMRLYPPVWGTARIALEDDAIGGFRIPAGSMMIVSPYVTHHDAANWEDPERFDPQRFTPEQAVARPRMAYIPFGGGQRLCIGQGFAMMEAAIILSTIARRCELRLAREAVAQAMIAFRPRDGLWMTLHPA
ncbi:MAG: cytochrome P450, partial [Myxococcales bacterium]